MTMACFKAYDVRGRIPDELNEAVAYRIGRAFAQQLKAKQVVIGHDVRLSSEALSEALANGLRDAGADVFDIALCGTEEIYFATSHMNMDGGIVVTASHNPMDYNGMKFVAEGSRPISGDSGLHDIRDLADSGDFADVAQRGSYKYVDNAIDAYARHLLTYVDVAKLRPLKIVVNAGNGGAGKVIEALEPHLPFEFIKVHHEPDGNFPNGIPNPLLPENRQDTIDAIKQSSADLGIAWDGDFDRCFLFDAQGRFIEGYYIVGLLAEALLQTHPGAKIIHDPRLTWNTIDMVNSAGGVPVQSKTGHAFIKERMRAENAVYGGEMSAHHYFRDFAYCDSGMIPWLLVTDLISSSGTPLAEMVEQRMQMFPCSGELNFRVDDAAAIGKNIQQHYADTAIRVDETDGLSMEFSDWRFNLRSSNTEPLLRLNVEARGDAELMQNKTAEISAMIEQGKTS
ncbi:MAG: phosphomannomutase [Chromatiales bacterium]|jgi:phosphomannomutase